MPKSKRDVFQAASPVDHLFNKAFDGVSLVGCEGRDGERDVVNIEERDGPSFSIGGVGSRRRPYVLRAGRGGSGASTGSDRSG